MIKKTIYILLIFITFYACKPEEQVKSCENPSLDFFANENYSTENMLEYDALIFNEGGYTYGNASITSWSETGNTQQNVFNGANNYQLGDVLQSYFEKNDELYLIVNNSQKIEVLNRENLQVKKTITGYIAPRYMTIIDNYILVTDIYANKISVINKATDCEMSPIEMNGWTEQIFNIDGKIYVIERSEVGASTLFANLVEIEFEKNGEAIDFSITNRTSLVAEPNQVVLDGFNNIWIMSAGNEAKSIYPVLSQFSTLTNTIIHSKTYTSFTNAPQKLYGNQELTNVYIYYSQGQKIYSLKEGTVSEPFYSTELFSHTAENLYNFSFLKNKQYFYLCDAKDYISEGSVLVYDINGNNVASIASGVIPSQVMFKK